MKIFQATSLTPGFSLQPGLIDQLNYAQDPATVDRAKALFKKKWQLNSLHQEIADNFYPERALFTVTQRDLSEEFAEHMMTSYPALIRRELADQIGTMLRPRGKK